MLILTVAEYLHELFEYGIVTTMTPLREARRVMIVAIDISLVFVVAVLSSEYCWAQRAGEMLNVVFSVERSDVRTTEGSAARVTYEV
jgi:hypothetical protein